MVHSCSRLAISRTPTASIRLPRTGGAPDFMRRFPSRTSDLCNRQTWNVRRQAHSQSNQTECKNNGGDLMPRSNCDRLARTDGQGRTYYEVRAEELCGNQG